MEDAAGAALVDHDGVVTVGDGDEVTRDRDTQRLAVLCGCLEPPVEGGAVPAPRRDGAVEMAERQARSITRHRECCRCWRRDAGVVQQSPRTPLRGRAVG